MALLFELCNYIILRYREYSCNYANVRYNRMNSNATRNLYSNKKDNVTNTSRSRYPRTSTAYYLSWQQQSCSKKTSICNINIFYVVKVPLRATCDQQ